MSVTGYTKAGADAAIAAAGGLGVPRWQATTAYTAGQAAIAPDGTPLNRIANGTSRASFDSTEQAAWNVVATKAGTLEDTALKGTYGAVVMHGSTAGTARPTTSLSVQWVGTVTPTNATNGDTYLNTTTGNEQVMVASAFQALNKPANDATYTAKNVPAYAGSRTGIFDGHSGYNQTATNMTRWRALLGTIMAGGGGDIGFIGDSLTAGSTTSGGTYQVTKAWPSFFRQLLQNVLPAGSCQDGFIRAVSTPSLADTRWSATGTWTNGTSFVYSTAVNSTDTLTTTNTGVNVSVWYYDWNDGSTFSITPGGGSATTVTCSGPQGPKRKDILGVTATSTVTIKHLTGTYMGLIGAAIWNPNTLLFHNLAQGGSTATGTGTGSWTDTAATNSPWTIYVAPHNVALNTIGQNDPQVMFHCLGANDMKTQTAAATKTAVQSIISAYSNSDNIPVAMQPLNTTYFSDATWTSWVSTVYDLAESLGNVGIDLRNIVGNYASCTAQTFTVDGQGHFQPFANALLARSIAKALRV